MVLIRFVSVLAAAAMLLGVHAQDDDDVPTTTIVTKPITTPTTTLNARALVEIGCFATSTPLESHGMYDYQSKGNCQLVCLQEGKDVFAVSDGKACWCGNKKPPKESMVSNGTCSTPCSGFPDQTCGGRNALWVVLTGNTLNEVPFEDPAPKSSSKASAPASTTPSAQKTGTPTPSKSPEEDSKPNTIGIAVGVVVGIVALFAIIGGVWFFLRRRRQKQAEEDYRRNAANVDQFVSGGKLHTSNSSMNDSRIDPSFGDRRQSNGSIADNEDYSRRILKVTNV